VIIKISKAAAFFLFGIILTACVAAESDSFTTNRETEIEENLSVFFDINVFDSMPEFTFNLQFTKENPEIEYTPLTYQYRLDSITIIDENGNCIQEIKSFHPILLDEIPSIDFDDWWMMPSNIYLYGIGFADFNFDGFLDFCLPRHGTYAYVFGNFHYFLWDSESEQYVINEQLMALEDGGFFQVEMDFMSDMEVLEGGNSNIYFDKESQLLIFDGTLCGSWFYFPPMERDLASWHIIQYYQYIDNQYTLVRIQEMYYNWDGIWRIRDKDAITGIETITYEYLEE
jgi:hypothetical protein